MFATSDMACKVLPLLDAYRHCSPEMNFGPSYLAHKFYIDFAYHFIKFVSEHLLCLTDHFAVFFNSCKVGFYTEFGKVVHVLTDFRKQKYYRTLQFWTLKEGIRQIYNPADTDIAETKV